MTRLQVSPLPDSNRRPLPYHGSRDHLRAVDPALECVVEGGSVGVDEGRDVRSGFARSEIVYFVVSPDYGLVKIGRCIPRELRRRLGTLRTQNAGPLHVVRTVACPQGTEPSLHVAFAPWRHHGEWFELDKRLWKLITSASDERIRRFNHVYRELVDEYPCPGDPGWKEAA